MRDFGISPLSLDDFDYGPPIYTGTAMAWNYEKGCDEPDPYPAGIGGKSPTGRVAASNPAAQNMPHPAQQKVQVFPEDMAIASYLQAEDWLEKSGWASPASKQSIEVITLAAFTKLETMLLGDVTKTSASRRAYIEWLQKDRGASVTMEELAEPTPDDIPFIQQITKEGYRRLALRNHPDQGGDREKFESLHKAYKVLEAVVKDIIDLMK